MTKFELPEKPKKTNTSEDFNNLRKAVDELDKFDYAWKTHANKADRRINAANKYIEELERENQRLIANAKPQQALPVVPDYVGNAVMKINLEHLFTGYTNGINGKAKNWLERHKGVKSLGYYVCQLRFQGFTVEKQQLFYLRDELTGQFLAKDNQFKDKDRYFFWTGADPLTHSIGTAWKLTFTQEEIDSMQTGSYELVPVEDGE